MECAFGNWKMRFAILKRGTHKDPAFLRKIMAVTCLLHNFLERRRPDMYTEHRPDAPAPPALASDADIYANLLPARQLREFLGEVVRGDRGRQ